MKVLIYSERKEQEQDVGWHRGGYNICYFNNNIKRENLKGYKSYYTFTFSYEFEYD